MKQPVDLELAKRLKEDIPDVIRFYSNKGIFIEVLADGYKLEGVGMCDALVEVIISDEEFFTKDA